MKKQAISVEVINWAQEALFKNGCADALETTPIVETAYSCVLKISCGGDIYYLKKTPPLLFIEAEIINFLRDKCSITTIPEVIAYNKSLNCFLMKACGVENLRSLFSKGLDTSLLFKGINNYKEIQRASTEHIQTLIDMGVTDWRLTQMPLLYKTLIHDEALLIRCGITPVQMNALKLLQGKYSNLCAELETFSLPDSLNHSDFQENNMLIDTSGQNVYVIDWGEVTIGNPLLPHATLLGSFSNRYHLDTHTYQAAEEKFFDGFFTSGQDKARAIAISRILSPIHYIYTLRNLERFMQQTNAQLDSRMNSAFAMFIDFCE